MTLIVMFYAGSCLMLAGGAILAVLVLQYRREHRYTDRHGPGLLPTWLHSDHDGTVYASRNARQG